MKAFGTIWEPPGIIWQPPGSFKAAYVSESAEIEASKHLKMQISFTPESLARPCRSRPRPLPRSLLRHQHLAAPQPLSLPQPPGRNLAEMERSYVQYYTVDERERAFMDSLRVIIQSGYFLAPHDF